MRRLSVLAASVGLFKGIELLKFNKPEILKWITVTDGQYADNVMNVVLKIFGVGMNTFWPAYNAALYSLGIKLCDSALDPLSKSEMADMLIRIRPFKDENEKVDRRQKRINKIEERSAILIHGILATPKTPAEKARVLEDYSPEENAAIFGAMLQKGGGREMLSEIIASGWLNRYRIVLIERTLRKADETLADDFVSIVISSGKYPELGQ